MIDIKKPKIMCDAVTNKGHNIFIEICIALLLFFISSMAMGVIQIPVLMVYMLSSREYILMLKSGELDYGVLMNIIMNRPEWIMIVILISEILLIFIMMLYCRFIEKRKIGTMGFVKKDMFLQYLAGILLGFAAFSTAYLLCIITGSVKWQGISENIVPIYIIGYFFGYLIQGMAEEVLCRGYLLVSVSKRYNIIYAIVVSSLFFAILHGTNQGLSLLAFINLFLFGVFAALLFIDCENIWIVGAFHSIWNFVQGNIYGIQVSGTGLQNSIFATSFTEGHEIVNGGSFGLEGGICVTIVYVVGIGLILMHLKKKGCILNAGEQALQTEKNMQPVSSEASGSMSLINSNNSANSANDSIADNNNSSSDNNSVFSDVIDNNVNSHAVNSGIDNGFSDGSINNNSFNNNNVNIADKTNTDVNKDNSNINNNSINTNSINTNSQNSNIKVENMYSSEPVIPDVKQNQDTSGGEVFNADYFKD